MWEIFAFLFQRNPNYQLFVLVEFKFQWSVLSISKKIYNIFQFWPILHLKPFILWNNETIHDIVLNRLNVMLIVIGNNHKRLVVIMWHDKMEGKKNQFVSDKENGHPVKRVLHHWLWKNESELARWVFCQPVYAQMQWTILIWRSNSNVDNDPQNQFLFFLFYWNMLAYEFLNLNKTEKKSTLFNSHRWYFC